MRSPGFQFVHAHMDRVDGVLVRVTVTTVVEAIAEPEPGEPEPGLVAYIIGGGDLR